MVIRGARLQGHSVREETESVVEMQAKEFAANALKLLVCMHVTDVEAVLGIDLDLPPEDT